MGAKQGRPGLGEQPHRPGRVTGGRVEHRRRHELVVEPGQQRREDGVVVQLHQDREHPPLVVGVRVRDVEPAQQRTGRARADPVGDSGGQAECGHAPREGRVRGERLRLRGRAHG
jgi:hypothetical protein